MNSLLHIEMLDDVTDIAAAARIWSIAKVMFAAILIMLSERPEGPKYVYIRMNAMVYLHYQMSS